MRVNAMFEPFARQYVLLHLPTYYFVSNTCIITQRQANRESKEGGKDQGNDTIKYHTLPRSFFHDFNGNEHSV